MKTTLFSNKLFVIISIITVSLSMTMTAPPQASAAEVETISGKLSDGTPYAVHKPEQWNGTIVLDLDGASNPKISPKIAWLTQHGYAYGGTTRNIPGYDFRRAVDNLVTVRSLFAGQFEMPTRTLIHGISRGSFVCRMAMEFEPDIFDGAVVGAGGGSGEIATLNSVLGGLFVLKTLVNPDSPMQMKQPMPEPFGVPETRNCCAIPLFIHPRTQE